MSKNKITRRQFVKDAATVAGVAFVSSTSVFPVETRKTFADQVLLGKTGIKLSRLGFGCGTVGGSVQRDLGHEKFNALVRYAYERGIIYFDTGDSYQTHSWVREALQGLPREKLYIQSKMMFYGGGMGRGGFEQQASPMETLERFRKELNVDYIDTVLIHCQITPNWDEQSKFIQDAMEEAKQKKIIRAHGVSCHSLPALKKAAAMKWVDVNLVRINPLGMEMDTEELGVFTKSDESHVPAVVKQLKLMRENGHGIIGMKLIAQGRLTAIEDRRKSIEWVMKSNLVDAVVIGMKSREEIDEAIQHINGAFA
jgi:aryl-alcohol dehydrogenase-like predicted oxidoreductase